MAYVVKVRCDNNECRKSVEVPQVGSLPDPDWIVITMAVPKMVRSNPQVEAPDTIRPEVVKFVYCSTACAMTRLAEVTAIAESEKAVSTPLRRRKR